MLRMKKKIDQDYGEEAINNSMSARMSSTRAAAS